MTNNEFVLVRVNLKTGDIFDASGQVVARAVPVEALDWLHGENGEFECPPERYFRGQPPSFWWRSVFRQKAATLDFEGLAVKVPERDNRFPIPQLYRDGWNDCLDALGVKS